MIELDLNPDAKKLRQFGWISLPGFAVLGMVTAWKTGAFEEPGKWTAPCILWALAVICWVLGLLAPRALKPIYIVLTLVAFPIGLIISNAVLLAIFFLLVAPLAVFFRLTGRDELNRKWDPDMPSYWLRSEPPRASESYYRQF